MNPQRLTPYANFRFQIVFGTTVVAGVTKVGGLTRSTQVIKHREGADPQTVHLAPGQTEYGPLTFERGVSYDMAFAQWANKTFDYQNSTGTAPTAQNTSLLDFRQTVTINIYNEAGQKVLAYLAYNCWVSEFRAMSELDGLGNALVIESMTVQNEGWQRDWTVTEQKEPSFTLPSSGG
ncbi:phage tail protein [Sorangium sp. So ce260]|uniref:phage tail protein n=1 Tax=Sorangium sp. So ce260 TaxID=3133291 RepID=UPI003F641B4F